MDDERQGALRLLFNERYPASKLGDGRQDSDNPPPPPNGEHCEDR